jgi:exodeoxyribonuclease V alpha subunit
MIQHDLNALLPPDAPWTGLPLTPLDSALACFLQNAQPSQDTRHLWLAALTHHLWLKGHACLDLNLLQNQAEATLGWSAEQVKALPATLGEAASNLPWTQGDDSPLVLTADRLYLRRAWVAEQTIRHKLQELSQTRAEPPSELQTWIDGLFSGLGTDDLALAQQADQRMACAACLRHDLTLVSGGPGTGKTTTVARMLALMQRVAAERNPGSPLRIFLAAPTGKAAARLAESLQTAIQRLPHEWRSHLPDTASTLHRWMVEQHKVWDVDVLVIDEASMVDLELFAQVINALPPHAKLILLGDPNQLASVEAGAVLAQLCEAPWLQQQRVHLNHSHRFRNDQGIGQWAKLVQDANASDRHVAWQALPQTWHSENHQVTRLQPVQPHSPAGRAVLQETFRPWWNQVQMALQAHAPAHVTDEVARQLLDGFQQVGVLCALREGPWGVHALNRQISLALGLDAGLWGPGRPIMVTRNNQALGLSNGDIGLCLPHLLDNGQSVLRVAFPQGQGVRWMATARLEDVEPVFAMTIHKSQGSEFDHVLLVMPQQPSPVLTRELIYTGITRAKDKLTWWAPSPHLVIQACDHRVSRSGGLAENQLGSDPN